MSSTMCSNSSARRIRLSSLLRRVGVAVEKIGVEMHISKPSPQIHLPKAVRPVMLSPDYCHNLELTIRDSIAFWLDFPFLNFVIHPLNIDG